MRSSVGIWGLISWVSGTLGTLGRLEYNNQIRFLVTEWDPRWVLFRELGVERVKDREDGSMTGSAAKDNDSLAYIKMSQPMAEQSQVSSPPPHSSALLKF